MLACSPTTHNTKIALNPSLIPLPVRVNAAADPLEVAGEVTPRLTRRAAELLPGVEVRFDVDGEAQDHPEFGDDENYLLDITSGAVSIRAPTVWGALHGLTSAWQLMQPGSPLDIRIEDHPRFPWRGLMIDVARHFMSLDLLQRVIEGMALLKLNVLHLHLTDDQGFRVKSKLHPELASREAYSLEELASLTSFAADRGIRVVPELDVPGHVTSWLVGMPELGTQATDASVRFGVHQGCLDPTSERVYEVLENLFRELATVFPDPYVHIGGDEVHSSWWQSDVRVQDYMEANSLQDTQALQNHFNRRIADILRALGKTPIGWDEVLHDDMPPMVVQAWRGGTMQARVLNKGLDCIESGGYYLDLMYPGEVHYQYDPGSGQAVRVKAEDDWGDDPRMAHVAEGLRWTHHWRNESEDEQGDGGRVLGGEACLWSELVDEESLETRLWSRLPAVAERLWSPVSVDDVDDYHERLEAWLNLPGIDFTRRISESLAGIGLTEAQIETVSYLEPVKWYGRLLGEEALQARLRGTEMPQARPYDVTTPLDRIIDFVSPESFAAREIRTMDDEELTGLCQSWSRIDSTEFPADVRKAVEALRRVGETWRSGTNEDLWGLYGPHGEFVVAVVPALLERSGR